jgi:hypothetical protein
MKTLKRNQFIAAALLALVLMSLSISVALAHERRSVGKYDFIVGFLNEPAYVNLVNSVDLRVTNHETSKPVEGLDKTLSVEVIVGGKTLPLSLSARFGQPGAYNAYFMPTKVGSVIFHFTGDIEGQKVDEKFESGPGRFGDVEDTAPLQFPEKLTDPGTLTSQLQAAQGAAANAQTMAYVGIAFGLIGMVLGAMGWMKNK